MAHELEAQGLPLLLVAQLLEAHPEAGLATGRPQGAAGVDNLLGFKAEAGAEVEHGDGEGVAAVAPPAVAVAEVAHGGREGEVGQPRRAVGGIGGIARRGNPTAGLPQGHAAAVGTRQQGIKPQLTLLREHVSAENKRRQSGKK